MCGIAGVYNLNGKPVVSAQIKNMIRVMKHRGPDEEGLYVDGEVGLGHKRLSIIDLFTGHQPMSNEDNSIWIVFNGEVYNYRELKNELETKGHIFRTKSDTETIIHSYEEEGEECLKKLNGIFAFCIWDSRKKKIILARDRLGVKPLFYSLANDSIVFASEVKSILQEPSIEKEIDVQALDDFFSLGYITGKKTIIKGIKSLPPATILTFGKNICKTQQYWDISYSNNPTENQAYYKEKLMYMLDRVIKKQMVSDVPVGAFLSGGLDSSCVVSFMVNLTRRKIKTFSIGFPEKSYDELFYARLVSRFFETDHKDMVFNHDINKIMKKLVWFYDEPFADTSAIPTYFLSKLASSELKVVLSGDGGDENFLGYPTYIADKLLPYYNMLPSFFKNLLALTVNKFPVSFNKVSFDYKIRKFIEGAQHNPLRAHCSWRSIYTDEEKKLFYCNDFKRQLNNYSPFEVFEEFYKYPINATVLQRLNYVDFKTWLVDDILRKVDRASMANSLEVRVPLLDYELVEFTASIPDSLKLKRLETKYLFKRSLRDRLPKRIIYRKKSGFNAPVSHWIKNELRSYVLEHLSRNRLQKLGYFQDGFIEKLLAEHFNQLKDNGLKIWNLLNFMLWYEIFIEGKSE